MSTRKRGSVPAPDLVERLNTAGREVSAATIMYHTALAARRGLSATEEKALDILLREGPMTHAELCAAAGLARPSVSDLIDRLERKGYASRGPHPQDRRRILVAANAEAIAAQVTPLFEPWAQALLELYASYTDDELEVICDFMTRAASRQREQAAQLTASTDHAPAAAPSVKPRLVQDQNQ
jgi:DNA-binding MarR family transcriptional regulator